VNSHPVAASVILTADVRRVGGDLSSLRAAFERGHLVRLRRGAYCWRPTWENWSDRDRHVARVLAVVAQARQGVVVAGVSAAAVWGLPTRDHFPEVVTVLDRYRGGGRSEPGVRRDTVGAATATVVDVGGIPVTDVARTALAVARTAAFPDAVATLDASLDRRSPGAVTRADLDADLVRFDPRVGRAHLARAVEFATDLSDSYGESWARAVIHEAGFPPPALQFEQRDAEGSMFADFAWPEFGVLGEFDGESKFTDPEMSGGDPLGRLRAQRRREARLRGLGWTVVRFEWADTFDPARVIRLLAIGRAHV
jgi:hypothetical protein